MENKIFKAKNLIKKGKIKRDSENFWSVEDHIVKLHKTPGACGYSCTCENFVRFNKSHALCYHLIAVILFESKIELLETIKEMKKEYKRADDMNLDIAPYQPLNDLEKLERLEK